MRKMMIKYSITNVTFMSDGLIDYPHFSCIKKLVFISRSASGISQIGCLDELGTISIWNIVEMSNNMVTDYELNVCLGGKFKMALNYTDSLLEHLKNIEIDCVIESIEIEFDPNDPQIFYFSTSEGLYKLDKHEESQNPVMMDTIGLGSPTAISMSDKGLLLAAFSCGSIW